MSYAKQILVWTRGGMDGIERDYYQGRNGTVFVEKGVTRASLKARHLYLGGVIRHFEAEIAKLR